MSGGVYGQWRRRFNWRRFRFEWGRWCIEPGSNVPMWQWENP